MNTNIYVDQDKFRQEFTKLKKANHLSVSKVAKASGKGESSIYHLLSPKERHNVTLTSAKKLGKGLHLNASQRQGWQNEVISTAHRLGQKPSAGKMFQPAMVHTSGDSEKKTPMYKIADDLRRSKHLSISKVAKRGMMNAGRVQSFLNGRQPLSLFDMSRLAKGLGTNLHGLDDLRKQASKQKPQAKPAKRTITKPAEKKASNKSANQPAQKQTSTGLRPGVLAFAKEINQLSLSDAALVKSYVEPLIDRLRAK